jgi:hypothetical protein
VFVDLLVLGLGQCLRRRGLERSNSGVTRFSIWLFTMPRSASERPDNNAGAPRTAATTRGSLPSKGCSG